MQLDGDRLNTWNIERPDKPEYIVLEASGVAEPSGIAMTFLGARLRDRIRLDSIMVLREPQSDRNPSTSRRARARSGQRRCGYRPAR